MDRQIVYPASIPLDTDFLTQNRSAMVALGALAQAVLGTATIVDGLACRPTSPASLSVTVGAGSVTQFGPVDALAYGSLAADTADQIVKMGINLQPTTFTLSPPTTPGESVIYLIEATFSETDATPVVLPYVNAANPSQPYSGPNNSGTAQNTQRIERVQLQLKAGAAANTGTETAPAIDSGWSGLYLITVNNGQSAITNCQHRRASGLAVRELQTADADPGFLPPRRPRRDHDLHRAARRQPDQSNGHRRRRWWRRHRRHLRGSRRWRGRFRKRHLRRDPRQRRSPSRSAKGA